MYSSFITITMPKIDYDLIISKMNLLETEKKLLEREIERLTELILELKIK